MYFFGVRIKDRAVSGTMAQDLPGFDSWVREDPLEKEMATTPVFLLGKSHGHRSLVGGSPWGRKESGMTEQLILNALSMNRT